MNDNDNRKWLYETLKSSGYNMGSYEEFNNAMDNDENTRRWCYDQAVGKGINMGSYDEYTSAMRGVQQPTTAAPTAAPKQPVKPMGAAATLPSWKTSAMPDDVRQRFEQQEAQPQQQPQQPTAQPQSTTYNHATFAPMATMQQQQAPNVRAPFANEEAQRQYEQQRATLPKPQPKQEQAQPLGPERFKKQMEMQQAVGKIQTDFNQRMADLRKNTPFNTPRPEGYEETPEGKAYQEYVKKADERDRVWGERHLRMQGYNKDFSTAAGEAWNTATEQTGKEQMQNIKAASKFSYVPGTGATLMLQNKAAHLKNHDMELMTNNAWEALGKEKRDAIVEDYYQQLVSEQARNVGKGEGESTMSREEAERILREQAEQMAKARQWQVMYDKAVEMNAPKDVLDFMGRKIVEGNTISKLVAGAARVMAGTRGDMEARDVAMQNYEREGHKGYGIAADVLQIATDPVTYMSGGAGGAVTKALAKGVEKKVAAETLKRGTQTLATRVLEQAPRVAGGATNFALFESLGNAGEQARMGGVYDPETGEYTFDMGEIGKAAGRGLLLGGAGAVTSGLIGNVGNKVYKNVGSTGGKLAVRGAEAITNDLAMGTIFAAPELISGEGDFDTWLDNVEMMAAFRLSHGAKAIPQRFEQLRKNPESRAGFETRLRTMLDHQPGLALTNDEAKELNDAGYNDLKQLVEAYKSTEGKLAVRGEEMPYNRFEELMNDKNISKAAKAKMYYYVTGKLLPQPTVVDVTATTNRDADGKVKDYTVETKNEKGEVITRRRFKRENEANVEFERMARQAEMNGIELLEQQYDQLSDDNTTSKMLRDVIGKETGVDIDKAIGKEPNRRSEKEQEALEEYTKRLFADVMPKEGHTNGTNYATRLLEGSGYDSVQQRISDDADMMAAQQREEAKKKQFRGDGENKGALRPVKITQQNGEPREVFLTQGEIVLTDSGLVDPEKTKEVNNVGTLTGYDPATGEEVQFTPADIVEVEPMTTAEQQEQNIEANKQAYIQQQIDAATPTATTTEPKATTSATTADNQQPEPAPAKPKGKPKEFVPGMTLTVTDREGNEHTVTTDGKRYTYNPVTGELTESENGNYLKLTDKNGDVLSYDLSNRGLGSAQEIKDYEMPKEEQPTETVEPTEPPTAEVPTRKGHKQIERAKKDLAEADDALAKANAIQKFWMNVDAGAEATEEEKAAFDNAKKELEAEGYEIYDLKGKDYDEGMIGDFDFVIDESLPTGTRKITRVRKPLVFKDGKMVQQPKAMVTQSLFEDEADVNKAIEAARGGNADAQATLDRMGIEWKPTNPMEAPMPMRKVTVGKGKDKQEVDEPDFMATTAQRGHQYIYNEKGYPREVADEMVQTRHSNAAKTLDELTKSEPKMSDSNIGGSMALYDKIHGEWQAKKEAAEQEVKYWEDVMAEQQKAIAAEQAALKAQQQTQMEAEQGVPDMSVDKAADARRRGYRVSMGNRFDRQEPVQGVTGSETEIKFSDNDKVKGTWKVVESQQVQPSHMRGQRNPLHFITEAQPKDRTDDVSDTTSDKIAKNINPKEITEGVTAYVGAPIINSRGEVVQGNNRAIALKKMAGYPESAAKYKQYLIDHAAEFGLNADEIAKMENPVLVREADVTDDEAIRLGQFTANDTESGGKQRMSAGNILGQLDEQKTKSLFNLLLETGENEEDMTLDQIIDRNGTKVMTWLNRNGVINATQTQSAYDSKGHMTPEARNDLKDLITHHIFKGGSDAIGEAWGKLPVAAQKALAVAMAGDLQLKPENRVLPYVQNAIMAAAEIKGSPLAKDANGKEPKTAEEWRRVIETMNGQTDMYQPVPIKERYNELELDMAVKFLTVKQKALQAIFEDHQRYITGGKKQTAQTDMFGNSEEVEQPMSNEEAIEKAFGVKLNTDNNGNIRRTTGGVEAGGEARGGNVGLGEGRAEAAEGGQPGAAAEQPAGEVAEKSESKEEVKGETNEADAELDALIADYKEKQAAVNKIWNNWLKDKSGAPAKYGNSREIEQEAYDKIRKALRNVSDEQLDGLAKRLADDNLLMFLIEGEQNRREENRERANEFPNGIAEQGDISKESKPVKTDKILPDFTSRDPQHPVQNCIYYDPDGHAVATDGHVLIASKSQYDPKQKGKMVAAHKVKGAAEKGDVLEGKFPNWKSVIPAESEQKTKINLRKLANFLAGAKDIMKGEKEKESSVIVRMPNGDIVGFDPDNLQKFVQAADAMGVKEVEYGSFDKPLIGRSNDGIVVVMPKLIGTSYDGKKFYYDLSDGSIKEQKTGGEATKTSERDRRLLEVVMDKLRKIIGDRLHTTLTEDEKRLINWARTAYHRVFHGSGADFERFDSSHMGEGEGAQAYGYGHYTTEVEGIGRTYAQSRQPFSGGRYKGKLISDIYGKPKNAEEEAALLIFDRMYHQKMTFEEAIEDVKEGTESDLEEFSYNASMARRNRAILKVLPKIKEADFELSDNTPTLYTVDIPDDNGSNYLTWNKTLPKAQRRRIADAVRGLEGEPAESVKYPKYKGGWQQLADMIERNQWAYQEVRDRLVQAFGGRIADEKRVSDLMHTAGFVGVKYPAEFRSGGREDGASNYVIFDDGDLKITDKIKFFKTPQGEVYGFTVGGNIYVDMDIAKADTPIHEYGHLWVPMVRESDPEMWEDIKRVLTKDKDVKPFMDIVRQRYPELTAEGREDDFMEEVFTHFSGDNGLKMLEEAAREYEKQDGKGFISKAKAIAALNKVKEALDKFWGKVAQLFGIRFRNAREVANKMFKDFMDEVDPMKVMRERTLMNPRTTVPNVRGGWNERKIKDYLKHNSTRSGVYTAARAISEFDNVDELKDHMFYHGTVYGGEKLKPSITMSERDAERYGGGGYGERYWGISLTKSKRVASHFSGMSNNIKIYPVILLKGAKVIERPDFEDAADLNDHIVELWNDGVDAVWIGKGKHGEGEQELCVINPRAVVNIGTPDFYNVYQLGTEENPLRIADDAAIKKMYETAKEYASFPKPNKPFEPLKPSKLKDNLEWKSDDEYAADMEAYEQKLADYEQRMDEYNNSEELRKYEEMQEKARKDIRFQKADNKSTEREVEPYKAPKRNDGEDLVDYAKRVAEDYEEYKKRNEKPVDAGNGKGNDGNGNGNGGNVTVDKNDVPRAAAREAYERMIASGANQFKEAVQDSMLSLKKLYEAILGKGTKIEDVEGYKNAYLAENRMHSASQAEIGMWHKDFMEPVVKAIHELTGGKRTAYDDLVKYMMAKHGLERNAVFAERDAQAAAKKGADYDDELRKNRGRDYAGLTALTGEDDVANAEGMAQKMVDDYEADHDTTELWNAINRATKQSLWKLASSGMMTPERYNEIRDMFSYYIPLQGFDETVAENVYSYMGNDGTIGYGTPIRHARGRKSLADDPIATMAMNGEAAIRQANRNEMKKRFLAFAQEHPSDLVSVSEVWLKHNDVTGEWEQVTADLNENDSPADVERKTREFDEKMEQLASNDPDHYKKASDIPNVPFRVVEPSDMKQHQVLVQRGGKKYMLTINGNPRAAQALNGLTNPDVFTEGVFGKAMNLGQWLNRQLSAFYTTRNPEFVLSNFLRDAIYSNSMSWVKESPNYALKFHKNFGKMNPVHMGKLFAQWENGKLRERIKNGTASETDQLFYDFMTNGGETGWTSLRDIEKHKKELQSSLKREGSTSRKAWKALGEAFDLMNRSVENCARFAAFVTSREMGRSIDRSISDAKEVSVNFNKKGAGDKFLTAKNQNLLGKVGASMGGLGRGLYVFFNASMQGLNNIARATKRHPGKAAGVYSTLFALGALAPILAEVLSGGDDDDDKNAYYNLPEYIRRSNICFRFGKDMPWITIPLPIEFRAIYGLGELSTGALTGKEHYTDEEFAKQYVSQLSQVLPLDFMEGGGGWHAFVPSMIKPYVEAQSNTSWTGLPIYRDNTFKPYDPEWTRAYSSANKQLVDATKWLNEATGGDDVTKGFIDWNPAKIEYMLKGYLGGYFTMYDRLQKTAETALGNRDFEWRNIPMASRVLREGDERTEARKLTNEYFDLVDEYNDTKHKVKEYEKISKSDREDAIKYAQKLAYLNNSEEYTRYLLMEYYKPILDQFHDMVKEADGEQSKRIKDEENALRRDLINIIHSIDNGAEIDVDAAIDEMLMGILNDEQSDISLRKKAQNTIKKHRKAMAASQQ